MIVINSFYRLLKNVVFAVAGVLQSPDELSQNFR